MLKLTLDGQNNRIVIEDNETLGDLDLWDTDPIEGFQLFVGQGNRCRGLVIPSRIEMYADFEGFVFHFIDKNGQEWSTEIIGLAVEAKI